MLPFTVCTAFLLLRKICWKISCQKLTEYYKKIFIIGSIVCAALLIVANLGVGNIPGLTISDSWGSNRGFIWRKVLELYKGYSLNQKLLGCGPDSLLPLMKSHFYDEMVTVTGQIFDSAHNDILHYLVTIGLPGALLYVLFWAFCLIDGIKKKRPKNNVWICVCICYCIQAMVVPSQPVTTPLVFVFAGLAAGQAAEDPTI